MLEEIATLQTLEKLYRIYLSEPDTLDPNWVSFFRGMELFPTESVSDKQHQVNLLIEAYRNFGHLAAPINPLSEPQIPKILEIEEYGLEKKDLSLSFSFHGEKKTLEEIVQTLQRAYLQPIAFEYTHCDRELRDFLEKRVELSSWQLLKKEKQTLAEELQKAEIFEHFLHTQFVGQTRFSLEGTDSLIPMLSYLVREISDQEIEEILIGMAHRGRLNVLANILQKPLSTIFYECLSKGHPNFEGSSDVKYHKGFSTITEIEGKKIELYMPPNPSHLESINPVILGTTKAKQVNWGGESKALALLIHGDASFAAQGVVYESQQLMFLDGYKVGGAIHIIVNNQIGFTASPEEGRSTRYPADLAKSFGCPIFHVNNESPEKALWAMDLALEIRQKFGIDSFIDLIGYRKYGHNEGDEPTYTQPLEYQIIRQKTAVSKQYLATLDEQIQQECIKEEKAYTTLLEEEMEKAKQINKDPPPETIYGRMWKEFASSDEEEIWEEKETKCDLEKLKQYGKKLTEIPSNFTIHPKLEKILTNKRKALASADSDKVIDWGFAESLAFASILSEEIPVRLAGEDSQRGTFSHRHAVWIDKNNGQSYTPFSHFSSEKTFIEVINSPLSEFAALGFEHGFSLGYPKALVLWEAQYGDFVNGAQIIIDEYIASTEQKWRCRGDVVVLLPHGYEGQGPDHSSGRIERFLELSAQENMQVCLPSTAKQYFHLLRRQAKRRLKKPLIIFTPKSLLRSTACMSSLKDLAEGSFEEFLDDPLTLKNPKKMILCSGKIFHELAKAREKSGNKETVLIRIEQFYPFHREKWKKIVAKYKSVEDFVYVQEEPQNMGGWPFISQLSEIVPEPFTYIGRDPAASPSTGSSGKHAEEQEEIINQVFSL